MGRGVTERAISMSLGGTMGRERIPPVAAAAAATLRLDREL